MPRILRGYLIRGPAAERERGAVSASFVADLALSPSLSRDAAALEPQRWLGNRSNSLQLLHGLLRCLAIGRVGVATPKRSKCVFENVFSLHPDSGFGKCVHVSIQHTVASTELEAAGQIPSEAPPSPSLAQLQPRPLLQSAMV